MGRAHGRSGVLAWLAACAAAAAVDHRPGWGVISGGAALCGIAARANDIDCPSSSTARVLGPLSRGVSRRVARTGARVHAATRTPRDRVDLDGHRTLTHTLAFALAAGDGIAKVCTIVGHWWPPAAAATWVALPVTLGLVVHCAGDSITNSATPFFWPLPLGGKTWRPIGLPRWLRISTGGRAEWWVNLGIGFAGALAAVTVAAPELTRLLAAVAAPWTPP